MCKLDKLAYIEHILGMETTRPKSNTIASFLKGFASAFDLSGQTFTDGISNTGGFERDAQVLRGDWERIENDLRKAMGQVAYGR